MTEVHVVLGATGAVGSEVLRTLRDQGLAVRAVHRRHLPPQPGVESVVADVSTDDGAGEALRAARTAYLCVQPPYARWTSMFTPLISTIADVATRCAVRLVYLDNLYGYGPVAGPMAESTPQSPTTRKGRVRAQIA